MSMIKNTHLVQSDQNEKNAPLKTSRNENMTSNAADGKRSAFNEGTDLDSKAPGRKRNLSDPSNEEENYDDYEDDDAEYDYYEDAHYKNEDIDILREEQKEFEGYGDDDFWDKP